MIPNETTFDEETSASNESPIARFLSNLRFDLFASTLGTIGLGLTWRAATAAFGLPHLIGEAILLAAAVLFIALLLLQLLRLVLCHRSINEEWRSSSQFVFFSAATISGSLLALAAIPYSTVLANWIWWPATAVQLALLVASMRRWIIEPHQISELSPTWFLPMVGNASAAFAGPILGYDELSRAMLISAIVCWLAFQPIMLFRLVFTDPKIPIQALPSLKILVSAPAVISIGLASILGNGNLLSEFATYCSLFFALCIASLGKRLLEAPFSRRWWGFTFPMAALSGALIRLHEARPGPFTATLSFGSLVLATSVVAMISAGSLYHAIKPLLRSRS